MIRNIFCFNKYKKTIGKRSAQYTFIISSWYPAINDHIDKALKGQEVVTKVAPKYQAPCDTFKFHVASNPTVLSSNTGKQHHLIIGIIGDHFLCVSPYMFHRKQREEKE